MFPVTDGVTEGEDKMWGKSEKSSLFSGPEVGGKEKGGRVFV